jgi:hypothetical protein
MLLVGALIGAPRCSCLPTQHQLSLMEASARTLSTSPYSYLKVQNIYLEPSFAPVSLRCAIEFPAQFFRSPWSSWYESEEQLGVAMQVAAE